MDAEALAAVDPGRVQTDAVEVLDALQVLVAAIAEPDLTRPSGCGDWSVRDLLNHIVFENLAHAALATGAAMPEPNATFDHLDEDPANAFRRSAEVVRAALTDPQLLTRTFGPTEAPGSFVAQMFVNEQLTHGWDLARALGASTDLAPDAARRALPAAKAFYGAVPRMGATYLDEQAVPPGATEADRLAAYLGRDVG